MHTDSVSREIHKAIQIAVLQSDTQWHGRHVAQIAERFARAVADGEGYSKWKLEIVAEELAEIGAALLDSKDRALARADADDLT